MNRINYLTEIWGSFSDGTTLLRTGVSKDIIPISSFILIEGLGVMDLVHATMILVICSKYFEIRPLLWLDTILGTRNVKINNSLSSSPSPKGL